MDSLMQTGEVTLMDVNLSQASFFSLCGGVVDFKHHFIRDKVESGELLLKYCPSSDMIANMLTKALPRTLFQKFRLMMNIADDA